MRNQRAGAVRPPIHLPLSESDLVGRLALQAEHRQPVVAAMLLEEIERAELHDAGTLPDDVVILGSEVTFVDEKTRQARSVTLVLPAHANIAEGRISILTPMGAALYGLAAGNSIDWPDLDGNARRIRILRVAQAGGDAVNNPPQDLNPTPASLS
jgi:regulator of nucleoside diphosphate kinase